MFGAELTNKISSINTMLGLLNLALSIGGKLQERLDIGELLMACINNMRRIGCLVHGGSLYIREL